MTRVGTGLLVSSWEGEMGWHNSMVIALHPRPQIGAKRTRAKLKRRTARVTGIPTTRSGSKKKDDRFTTNLIVVLFVIALVMYFYFLS